jgi:hypothetical protein
MFIARDVAALQQATNYIAWFNLVVSFFGFTIAIAHAQTLLSPASVGDDCQLVSFDTL